MKNIGKEVFVESGKKIGYVLDVLVDFQSFNQIGYIVVDEESETEFVLENANIESEGDFLLSCDESCLKYLETQHESLIGKKVLGLLGQDFGRVIDLLFERKKCKKLVTEKCEVETKFVKVVGKDAIFVSFKRVPKRELTKSSYKTFDYAQSGQKIVVPEKISLAFNFYSGKVAKEDVFGYNNERIVTKGDVISRAVFENVKKHNKLNELFFVIR